MRLLQSAHASLLITWGWRQPAILIPAGAEAWSAERIRVVLAHEYAHIARHDWVVQVAAELLRAACWCNPMLWLACRRLRNESERACDDAVLAQGIDAVGSLQETITVTDKAVPPAPPDAATLERREAARRRFDELIERSKARCAADPGGQVGGNILPPRKLVDVRPTYPEHLKAARIAGVVTLDAVIGTDGMVRDIQNLRGPDPALELAAADAVRQWQFSATFLNCDPIEVDMHVTTNFRPEP